MNKEMTTDQCKDTALAIILILLIISAISRVQTYLPPAIIVLILAMTCPKIFKPLAKLWFGLSHFMGEFVSKILMSVVFFLMVVPLGFFRKAMGKDSMNIAQWKTNSNSAFKTRDHTFTAADLEKPF